MTPEEKIANDVLIKDLQDTIKEQIIVYNDISREATDYRNEVTQLKKELETWKTTVITQHKVFEEQENQILQIKSTLDEIKKIDEELTRTAYGYWTIESLHKAIKKALAKHEDDK